MYMYTCTMYVLSILTFGTIMGWIHVCVCVCVCVCVFVCGKGQKYIA